MASLVVGTAWVAVASEMAPGMLVVPPAHSSQTSGLTFRDSQAVC